MKDLVRRIGRFCENHVEKMVLGIAGVICTWLFFTQVVFSPNAVRIDETGRAYAPGEIDRRIYDQKAQTLRAELSGEKETKPAETYVSRFHGPIAPQDPTVAGIIDQPLPDGFVGLFECPLSFIEPAPTTNMGTVASQRRYAEPKYRLPAIPRVTEVDAGHIRAAAYVPAQENTTPAVYDQSTVRLDDLDLVTVEGRFDIAELRRRFEASFAGVDVLEEQWRDPNLARPVFAAVRLERQELLADGTWSLWQAVPRSRLDADKDRLDVCERVQDLPLGGLGLRMMLFDCDEVAAELLQPQSYQIASAEEQWFPPSYHARFVDLQEKTEREERRAKIEEVRRQSQVASTTTSRETQNRSRSQRTDGAMRRDVPETVMQSFAGDGTDAIRVRRKGTVEEVYYDFAEERIAPGEDLSRRDAPLLLWAFDDTVEPGKTYRYRICLGVFNPVAGTNRIMDQDMDKRDRVVLWSPYSDVTEPVEIEKRVYVFPKSVQQRAGAATVEVARYTLGYWRSRIFSVRLGEEIGREVETEDDGRGRDWTRADMTAGLRTTPRFANTSGDIPLTANPQDVPRITDYRTGKVLIDLVPVTDWGAAPDLRQRKYYDMLCTADGVHMEHMPVDAANWPKDLTAIYRFIQTSTQKERQPFRAFDAHGLYD